MENKMAELIKEKMDELDERSNYELKREAMVFDVLKSIKNIEIETGESRGYDSEVLLLRLYIDNGERDFVYTSSLWGPKYWTTTSLSDQFMNILVDIYSISKK